MKCKKSCFLIKNSSLSISSRTLLLDNSVYRNRMFWFYEMWISWELILRKCLFASTLGGMQMTSDFFMYWCYSQ